MLLAQHETTIFKSTYAAPTRDQLLQTQECFTKFKKVLHSWDQAGQES